jgi:hypothetical protein
MNCCRSSDWDVFGEKSSAGIPWYGKRCHESMQSKYKIGTSSDAGECINYNNTCRT